MRSGCERRRSAACLAGPVEMAPAVGRLHPRIGHDEEVVRTVGIVSDSVPAYSYSVCEGCGP